MKTFDQQQNNSYLSMDGQFTINELLKTAIASSKKIFSLGLDRIDYAIIRSFPICIHRVLLSIFNEMFDQGLFPQDWRTYLVIFVPKLNCYGFCPMSLMSCLLKIFK